MVDEQENDAMDVDEDEGGDEEDDADNDDEDAEGDKDGDDDQDEAGSPSQRRSLLNGGNRGLSDANDPRVTRTSPSPQAEAAATGVLGNLPFRPSTISPQRLQRRAAPRSTPSRRRPTCAGCSAAAPTATSASSTVDTDNGKLVLTVAQRHPFVDSVTKAGVLLSYWENEDSTGSDAPSPVYSLAVHHQSL